MDKIKKLNLQLFAEPNTNVTTANTTGNDLSGEMKTYYSKELIEMASANLVHNQFGDKKPIPQHGGKKIEWRKWSHYPKALVPLTEGVTPDGRRMNMSTIEKEISQYGDYTTISDLLDLTAIDDVILEATDKHGEQMGYTLDTVTRNELCTGLNVLYGGTGVNSRSQLTATDVLTPDLVARAATELKKENAPKIDGSYVSIIHPSVAYDLRKSEDWINYHQYAAVKPIFNGEIGELHGVRFVETTEAKIFAPAAIAGVRNKFTLKTALNGTGSTTIAVEEAISAEEAAAANAAIGEGVTIYVGGKAATMTAVNAGAAGSATLTVADAVQSVDAGALVCGGGAGADGSAVYGCLFLGKGAYGVVNINGAGAEVIAKQRGSGQDPLNQRSTVGWKALHAAKILIPEYILRVEVGSAYSGIDEAN